MKKILQLLTLGFALSSHATLPVVLYSHIGDADPTTEGWSALISGTTVQPVLDFIFPAWSIVNTNTANYANYSVNPTGPEVNTAATFGWSLQTTLRITSDAPNTGGSMMSLYRDGTTSYQMHFGRAANGDPTVLLFNNTGDAGQVSYTVAGGGGGYHTFELLFSAADGSADLFVDGFERVSNYTGFAWSSASLISWGDGSSAGALNNLSSANYIENIFSVTAVPEPSVASTLMVGSAALFGMSRLFRRKKNV